MIDILPDTISVFKSISESIKQEDLSAFLYHSCQTDVTSLFVKSQIDQLTTDLVEYLNDHPGGDWDKYLVDTNLFKKKNLKRFFDEIGLATANVDTEIRIMTPEGTQKHNPGFPDCIILDKQTPVIRGVEFKHFKSPVRNLTLPRYNHMSYEVLTRNDLKPHFRQNPLISQVYGYSDYLHGRSPQYYKRYCEQQATIPMVQRYRLMNIVLLFKK